MKKIVLFLIMALFMPIIASAALVEGDDVYHFDLTELNKYVYFDNGGNWYDYSTTTCLKDYFESYNDDEYEIDSNYTFYKGTKELFTLVPATFSLDKAPNLSASDNFVIDVSETDSEFCRAMTRYGFNKIAVYFESDEEIPVFKDFIFDLTNLPDPMSKIFSDDEYFLESFAMQVLFYMKNDDIIPNLNPNTQPDLPLTMKVNEKGFLKIYTDENTHSTNGILLNEDQLTVNDNQTYTKAQIIEEFSKPEYTGIGEMVVQYMGMFDNVSVIISHNPPVEEETDEEVTPEKKEEKKEEKKNPATGDNIIAYISLLSLSTIGLSIVKIRKKKLEY